ncbi:MAG: hypothetical protein IKJ68_06920 [Clostridia bacterium]|nr:hypothetical protein [Clostridia bacterium]
MNSWNDWFNAKTNDYIEVKLSAEEINAVEFLAKRIAASKKDEDAYKKDGIGIEKRYLTGLIGEYAVVKVLSDWGLCKKYNFYQSVGASYDFNIPDLIEYGFGMGCKTCGTNRNVKVKENEVYPEIISVYDKNKSTCTICGIATPEIINKYSSPDLITEDIIHVKDGKVTAKVGFNRFDLLLPFTLDNVMKYKSNLKANWFVGLSDNKKKEMTCWTTYVDYKEIDGKLKLTFYNCKDNPNENSIIEVVDPYSEDGIKSLEQILEEERLYIGFRIKTVFEWIQTYWKEKKLSLNCIDIWDMIYGDRYYVNVWAIKSRSEGLSNLNLLRQKDISEVSTFIRKVKCGFAYSDLYLFIWMLINYRRTNNIAC